MEPTVRQAVVYARVSSKEQEKEGFSIPAQLKLLKDYAAKEGFSVVQEYVDVETAKIAGRASFGDMVTYLRAHPSVRVLLVEKTDRLYRNLKDWVTIDELDMEVHLPKEGVVLSRDSRSSEKFMHGIKVLMAKNYIDNLSEEAREKRRLLNFVLSNCTWDDGEVVATFRQPFDLLAETTAIASRSGGNDGGNSPKSEIWLPKKHSIFTVHRVEADQFGVN